MSETPNVVHGRLLEAMHITGYSFERACSELKWLLTEDRWKQCGFTNVQTFMKTIDLSEFRATVEQRKEIAKLLTSIEASQRSIAKTLGVSEATIARDCGKPRGATFVADGSEKDKEIKGDDETRATNVAPSFSQSGTKAAATVEKVEKTKQSRDEKEKQRKADLERPVETKLAPGLYHGDFRKLSDQIEDSSVQLVFTDPPYDADSVALYGDAARIARRILRPGGSFIAYSGQRHLPDVLAACATYLDYWWTISGQHSGADQILNKLGIRCGWKPLVWFVRGTRGDVQNVLFDVVTGAREKDVHEWQQSEQEARYYIEKLTSSDGLVVDFFIGGGTTAVAAKSLGRKCIGFEINATTAERASKRVESV